MNVALTGSDGFLSWHIRCFAKTMHGVNLTLLNREILADSKKSLSLLRDVDIIIHTAGVNRGDSEKHIYYGNLKCASQLADAIGKLNRKITVVNCNSTYVDKTSAYSRSKREASRFLEGVCTQSNSRFIDFLLPNLFGENGRPFYNSVVATYCYQLANGGKIEVFEDRQIELIHAQDISKKMFAAVSGDMSGQIEISGYKIMVANLAKILTEIASNYEIGIVPDLKDKLTRDLFNTYLSFIPTARRVRKQTEQVDERGALFETIRVEGGYFQSFVSKTAAGKTRGNHFHYTKFERFFVLQGEAVIRLRRLFSDSVAEFRIKGSDTSFIDMPTMWAHSIENVGKEELITSFYAEPLFDPDNSDTFPEEVLIRK